MGIYTGILPRSRSDKTTPGYWEEISPVASVFETIRGVDMLPLSAKEGVSSLGTSFAIVKNW